MSTVNFKKNEKIFIGKYLKELRSNKGLTLEKLSDEIQINIKNLIGYEGHSVNPSLNNLIILSNYFGISLDYFILWENNNYINSIDMLTLSQKVDSLDQVKRFQIENTINTLIKKDSSLKIKFDTDFDQLGNNIHENIKIIREKKELSQIAIADYLGIKQSVVSNYEKSSIPPIDKLIKLSNLFNMSIHSLATGITLNFDFRNLSLKEAILNGDKLLSLKDKDFLIHLMQKIIDDDSSS